MQHNETFVYVIVSATGKRLNLPHSGVFGFKGIIIALNQIKAGNRRVSGLGTTGSGPAMRGVEGPEIFRI